MEDFVVTWGEIRFVLVLLGAGILFYLLLSAIHLMGILKNIHKMLNTNRDHISNSLEKLPKITENVAKVSDMVRDEMESIQKLVGNIGKISDTARDAAEMIKKDIVVKAKNILDIIDWIKNLFQDKSKKKKEVVYQYKYKPAETVEEQVSYPGNDFEEEKKSGEKDEASEVQPDNTKMSEQPDKEKTEETQDRQGTEI